MTSDAPAVEAPLLSKAKGKVIDETVSDEESEEELEMTDVQENFQEAWDTLESARYIIQMVGRSVFFRLLRVLARFLASR